MYRRKKKKKEHKKKLGKTPPVSPLGAVPDTEERTPPTWGSNLVEVKDLAFDLPEHGEEEEGEPELESFGPLEGLSEVSLFIEEFKKGEISKKLPKKPAAPAKGALKLGKKKSGKEAAGAPRVEITEPTGEERSEDEDEEDLDKSQFDENILEDSQLMSYLEDQREQRISKKQLTVVSQDAAETPATAGIPVTTPRPAPSPKRPASLERLVRDDTIQKKRPPPPPKKDQGEPTIDVDDFTDEELAVMGMTREEARRAFADAANLFEMPTEEEDISVETPEVSFEEDEKWSQFDQELDDMQKQLEKELAELEQEGYDINVTPEGIAELLSPEKSPPPVQDITELPYYDPSEFEMVEYQGRLISRANYEFLMEDDDEPPPPPAKPAPPKQPSPKPGKGKKPASKMPTRTPAKPGAKTPAKPPAKSPAKPAEPKPSTSKLKTPKPGVKKAKAAAAAQTEEKKTPSKTQIGKPSKLRPPGKKSPAAPSKIPGTPSKIPGTPSRLPGPGSKAPMVSKLVRPTPVAKGPPAPTAPPAAEEPPALPESPVRPGSPEAAPLLTEFERMARLRERVADIIEEGKHHGGSISGGGLVMYNREGVLLPPFTNALS